MRGRRFWPWLAPLAAGALPVIQLLYALQMLDQLEAQREVYLRSRAAAIAARLETLPSGLHHEEIAAFLAEEEPLLTRLDVVQRDETAQSPELRPLWEGKLLFRAETAGDVYRATVPFHADGELLLARIELPREAADFLVVPARRNLVGTTLLGLLVMALALATMWAVRRSAAAEQRRLELEHLAQTGRMAAALAHEIRNPLGTMKGFAQLLRERTGTAHQDLLQPIVEESRRLEALVQDLLWYGRPRKPELEEVEAHRFAERLLPFGGDGMRVEVPPMAVRTDPRLLEQALLNLIRNAREAVEGCAEPRILLSLQQERQALRWRVEDNGPGFPASARDTLFVPFQTTKAFGTGLGLAIVQRIAESLGGRVEAGNGAAGGARVDLVLPVAP